MFEKITKYLFFATVTSWSRISLQKPIDCCRSTKLPLDTNFVVFPINSGQTSKQKYNNSAFNI